MRCQSSIRAVSECIQSTLASANLIPGSLFQCSRIGADSVLHSFSLHLDVLSYLDEISLKYESPMRLWFGPQMVVFIADAENAEIVLKSKDCLNKPYDFYKILRDALNVDGFFTLKGLVSIFCCFMLYLLSVILLVPSRSRNLENPSSLSQSSNQPVQC